MLFPTCKFILSRTTLCWCWSNGHPKPLLCLSFVIVVAARCETNYVIHLRTTSARCETKYICEQATLPSAWLLPQHRAFPPIPTAVLLLPLFGRLSLGLRFMLVFFVPPGRLWNRICREFFHTHACELFIYVTFLYDVLLIRIWQDIIKWISE